MPSEDNKEFDTSTFGKKMFEKKSREMFTPNLDTYEPDAPSIEEQFGKDFLKQRTMNIIQETASEGKPFIPGLLAGSEESRFKKMQMLNGNTFDNGERSQGDQEAEQRMVQNKKTGLLQKFVDKIKEGFSEVKAGLGENPFNKALEKEFGTEDQPKFGGKDGVMYNGQFVHPDFYKLIMNRPDLKERFDRTGSIYGD